MKIELSIDLVNQILNYLGTRPYQEVAGLIQTVQSVAQQQLPPPDTFETPT